jgi:glycosyltransferase involved in cell wall biosynthesis
LTNSNVKVSVLMPSYNYARYLPAAIESVLSQSYGDLELIIIDDCSTDDSREIAEGWKKLDRRVIPVLHKVNTGLSGARNSGLSVATGDFVALCDADDLWDKGKLKMQLDRFYGQPEIGAVHSDARIIDDSATPTGRLYSADFHGENQQCSGNLFKEFCLRNFVCNSTVVLRRECLDYAGGFDQRLRSLEDWVCWARISKQYQFGYVDEPLVSYRVHNTNLSRQVQAMAGYRVTAVNLLLEDAEGIPRQLKSHMLYSLGVSQMELGDRNAASGSFYRSVCEDLWNLKAWVRWAQAWLVASRQPKPGTERATGEQT